MRRGIVVGFDYHARFLAETVNEFSNVWRLTACATSTLGLVRAAAGLLRADALIVFGGPAPHPLLSTIAQRRGLPIIIIWAGSDVLEALERPHTMALIRYRRYTHWAVAPWLVDELRRLGLRATCVPVAAMRFDSEPPNFDRTVSVLSYLPEPRREFYGRDRVYAIARRLPALSFNIVGVGEPDPNAPANVRFLGHRDDVRSLIDGSVALLRLPEHDGMSLLVLETLSRGRYVAWINSLPGVTAVDGEEEAARFLGELAGAHARGALALNAPGYMFARTEFSFEKVAAGLEHALEGAAPRAAPLAKPALRVAISGLDFFVAELAALNERSGTPWELRVLGTRSRFEILASMWLLLRSDLWYIIGTPETHKWIHRLSLVLRKPRLMHWVGTDIQIARECLPVRAQATAGNATHIAEVEWTVRDLQALGIAAAVAPLPPRLRDCTVQPFPAKFTVLLYVPQLRQPFYGAREYERLIAAVPSERVRFLVVGGGRIEVPAGADVHNFGWQESLQDVYAQTTVLIRFTMNDGLSLMVLEALARGRHVLWPQHFPHVHEVRSYEAIERETLALLERHEAGTLELQTEASEYVRTQYDPDRCLQHIAQAWANAAGREQQPVPRRVRALAEPGS